MESQFILQPLALGIGASLPQMHGTELGLPQGSFPCRLFHIPLPTSDRSTISRSNWSREYRRHSLDDMNQETRKRFLFEVGKCCFLDSQVPTRSHHKTDIDGFISKLIGESGGSRNCWRECDVIYFNWFRNPNSSSLREPPCLNRITGTNIPGGPVGPHECLVGYVTEMWSAPLGRPVRVNLLESPKSIVGPFRFRIVLS